MLKWNRKGQTTAEYAVLAAVVIGALLAMQIYVKRGAMGRLKDSADQLGEQFSAKSTTSSFDVSSFSKRQDVTKTDGSLTSTIQGTESQKRESGTVNESKLDDEKLFR